MLRDKKLAARSQRSFERLEARRLLAGDLDNSSDSGSEFGDFETDNRIIGMFHGPLQPGAPVPPVQAFAPLANEGTDEDDGTPEEAPPFPLDQTFKLHSRPDSNFTIYMDFDGHTTVGTSWNAAYGIAEIVHPNYWGGTGGNFSDARLELIQKIWQVVAEDFAAFDVNVTTEEPTDLGDLSRNGADDTRWGSRAVMTKDTFANCGCGGHAFLGAFDDATDEPALVYNGGLNAGSETVSHEVGHQLGLNHDGKGGSAYYGGHGSGATGWGPIMGAPFSKLITHWNNGDYYDANNTGEDDLAIITGANNFPYTPDDHSNDRASASTVNESQTTTINAFGIIEKNDDVDWFKFTTGGGDVDLDLNVISHKPNLDIWAGLFDSSGNFITDANPQDDQDASFGSVTLTAGEYFIKVDGVARNGSYDPVTDQYVEPDPAPYTQASTQGYSDYGSLGQYGISGTIIDRGIASVSIAANTDSVREGNNAEFTLTTSDNSTGDVVVEIRRPRQAAPGLPAPNATEDADFSGPLSQTVSIVNGTATLQIPVVDDAIVEPNEFFEVVIVDPGTYAVADRVADMEVLESKAAFGIFPVVNEAFEGDSGTGSTHQYRIQRFGREDIAHTVAWARSGGSADNADFVTGATGSVAFASGELSKILNIDIAGDIDQEANETYNLDLQIPTGETFLLEPGREGTSGTILDDESVVVLTTSAQLRFRQVAFSNGNFDHWAIDNVVVTGTSFADDFDPDIDNAMWDSIERAITSDLFPGTDGDALFFNGFNGPRVATTVSVSPPPGAKAEFDIIFADANGNGLNATENGEDSVLEYSLDGTNWVQIARYDESTYTTWSSISEDLPAQATFEVREYVETDSGTNSIPVEISRSGYLDKAIDVDWEVRAVGTNPVDADDFVGGLPSGTLSFAAGADTATLQIPVAGDYTVETDETFELVLLSNSGGPLNSQPMQMTIIDDDTLGSDYGDAPSDFPVTLADDGARHDTSGPRLGATRAGDLDGQESAAADADTDEDGVEFFEIGVDSDTALVNVDLQNATNARVDAWIDFDANGFWENDEKIFDNLQVDEGTSLLSYSVAADAVLGTTYARVRVSSAGGLATTGFATDGEVEDYQVSIVANPAIESIVVNGGSQTRGQLTQVDVAFDTEVLVADGAFAIVNRASNEVVDTVAIATTTTDGKTTSQLTFTPGTHVLSRDNGDHTLIDGNYELRIDASLVTKPNNGPGLSENVVFGNDDADRFFRFYGDTDADRDVDIADLGRFADTFRSVSSQSEYDAWHDYDGDGDVDIQDLGEFGNRFRTTI